MCQNLHALTVALAKGDQSIWEYQQEQKRSGSGGETAQASKERQLEQQQGQRGSDRGEQTSDKSKGWRPSNNAVSNNNPFSSSVAAGDRGQVGPQLPAFNSNTGKNIVGSAAAALGVTGLLLGIGSDGSVQSGSTVGQPGI